MRSSAGSPDANGADARSLDPPRTSASTPAASVEEAGSARHETIAQRDDRNLAEILQELRIAGLGVQVLFGFLLSVPFDARFALDAPQHDLYVASVLLAALAVILLSAPVAFHRMLFRLRLKERLVLLANMMAIAGLGAVALAMTSSLWLVSSMVVHGAVVPLIVSLCALVFTLSWFVLPAWVRVLWHPEQATNSAIEASQ